MNTRLWYGYESFKVKDENGNMIKTSPKECLRIDNEMRSKFEADVEKLAQGEYDNWATEIKGVVALCILGDQIPRNIYRKTAKAFMLEYKILPIALNAIESKSFQSLHPGVQSFVYLPLMHSENMNHQEKQVAFYTQMANDLSEGWAKDLYQVMAGGAKSHMKIVQKFGRYPHRNEVLGRESTPEEVDYLNGGNRFGQ
eukprot:Awhi_evm1s5237